MTCPNGVKKLGLAVVVLLALAVPASAGTGRGHVRYPVLTRYHGMNVYGPHRGTNAICPRGVVREKPAFARVARGAVAAAMPAFARSLKLDGRDPVVRAVAATRSGLSARAGGCGVKTWRKSFVAFVRFPHVRGASLSQHTFAVARFPAGLVLWALIH
jgi:hypothetical protein